MFPAHLQKANWREREREREREIGPDITTQNAICDRRFFRRCDAYSRRKRRVTISATRRYNDRTRIYVAGALVFPRGGHDAQGVGASAVLSPALPTKRGSSPGGSGRRPSARRKRGKKQRRHEGTAKRSCRYLALSTQPAAAPAAPAATVRVTIGGGPAGGNGARRDRGRAGSVVRSRGRR